MVKLRLSICEGPQGMSRYGLSRELAKGDERSLDEYCRRIIDDVPNSEPEIRTLGLMYFYLSSPVVRCDFLPVESDLTSRTSIDNIVKGGKDVTVYLVTEPFPKIDCKSEVVKEATEEFYRSCMETCRDRMVKYGAWQMIRFLEHEREKKVASQSTAYEA